MALLNLRRKATGRHPAGSLEPKPPPQWPVDAELARRVTKARAGLARTRRELRRHVLPDRQQRRRSHSEDVG